MSLSTVILVFLQVSQLSAGQKRRLWLSVMSVFSGKLLLLDEPFLALDKSARLMLEKLIESYLKHKKGILVVATHLMEKVNFCTKEIDLTNHLPKNIN